MSGGPKEGVCLTRPRSKAVRGPRGFSLSARGPELELRGARRLCRQMELALKACSFSYQLCKLEQIPSSFRGLPSLPHGEL